MSVIALLFWMSITVASLNAPQVFKAGDEGVIRPRLLTHVAIEYSEEARQAKLEGEIELTAVIRADGSVANVEVIKGFGAGMDQEAVKALKQWHFEPAEKDGEPVAFKACVTMRFKLL